jgi:hypothetical protein
VAEELGVAQSKLSDASRHVEAVKRYPELGAPDVSQSEAQRLWNAWEAMTLTNRSRARRA